MADPNNTFVPEKAGTPAPEAPEQEAPEIILEEDVSRETPEDDGKDDLEIGPTKYRVEKPLKEAWNGLQNSTKADKEALKAERAQFVETQRTFQAVINEVTELRGVDKQLEVYKDMTPQKWIELHRQSPESAAEHQINYNALIAQRAQLQGTLSQKVQAAQALEAKNLSDARAAAERELPLKIKDWSPAKKESLQSIGVDLGWGRDEIEAVSHDPRVMAALNEIAEFRAAKARAKAAAEKAKGERADATPAPAPVAKVRGSGPTSTNLGDNQSMNSFANNFRKTMRAHKAGQIM